MRHHSVMQAGKRRRQVLARVGGFAVGLMLGGVLVSPAVANGTVIDASEVGYQFVGSPIQMSAGTTVSFNNPVGSPALHNVYANSKGPDGRKLFFSETIAPGAQSPVAGTEYLTAGSYPFVCTLHPGMAAVLQVTGEGEAVERPSAKIAIPAQRLASVRRSGALKVRLSSRPGATGVGVTVAVGSRKIGTVRSLSVARGGTRTIVVRLTPQGKARLQGAGSVRISASTTVPFGFPSTARKAIR